MSEEIINGIDVSECEYLNSVVNDEPYCDIDQEHLYTCSSNENCYYKQLKRLQAENERLNWLLKTKCQSELERENEELQEDNELIKRLLNDILRIFNLGQYDFLKDQNEIIMALEKAVQKDKDFYEFTELSAENERLKQKNEELENNNIDLQILLSEYDRFNKYRKALEEIKEVCSNTCEKNKDCIHSCYECKSIDEPVAINRILNKINEVLK